MTGPGEPTLKPKRARKHQAPCRRKLSRLLVTRMQGLNEAGNHGGGIRPEVSSVGPGRSEQIRNTELGYSHTDFQTRIGLWRTSKGATGPRGREGDLRVLMCPGAEKLRGGERMWPTWASASQIPLRGRPRLPRAPYPRPHFPGRLWLVGDSYSFGLVETLPGLHCNHTPRSALSCFPSFL